ncbi:tubulin-tyrosine ligase [Peniophora sp. CONT]|nr:tubulin-tyrosine ligase [Peniophora sp. CONT]
MTESSLSAFVSWPGAPLTKRLVLNALDHIGLSSSVTEELPELPPDGRLLQWATYDALNHDLTHESPSRVLSSSYVFRKALIRKHYLSRCIHSYLVKHPESSLTRAAPRTWELELSFADELDDMWGDELWDLGEALENGDGARWFILKPGMADRGQGIRLFNSKDALQRIFEGFEEDSDDEENEAEDQDSTAVMTSQLRHFVIQEYLSTPLLLDPRATTKAPTPDKIDGHKFHLRVYCVASGAMRLYMYTRILALFSSKAYTQPQASVDDEDVEIDLAPHLTNTSLQTHRGEEGVRLLDELVGLPILSGSRENVCLTAEHLEDIQTQMAEALAETFKAALAMPIHYQPVPNAFELYGIDFLVSDETSGASAPRFQVKLLEVNAEPAIELTGPRLTWILEDLFKSIAEVAVRPFAAPKQASEDWAVGEIKLYLRKCLDTEVRGAAGW